MADLQAALAEAVKLNQSITRFLKFTTYPISYLTRPVVEESRLSKGTVGKYRTAKGHYYDCTSVIEALVSDEYHDVPYWTITNVEHNGEDYYLVGHKGIPMKGLRVRVRTQPWPWQ